MQSGCDPIPSTSRHLHPSTCCHFSHNHHSSSTLGSCTNLEVHCVMTLPPKTLLKLFTFNINVTSLQAYQTNIVLISADLAENQHIKIATKFWRYEADMLIMSQLGRHQISGMLVEQVPSSSSPSCRWSRCLCSLHHTNINPHSIQYVCFAFTYIMNQTELQKAI